MPIRRPLLAPIAAEVISSLGSLMTAFAALQSAAAAIFARAAFVQPGARDRQSGP
jgi:hypothetical protein